MNKKVLALLFIVSLLIGFAVGKIYEKEAWQLELTQTQEELDLLKSQLEIFYPPIPEEIYRRGGTVTEMEEKFLIIETGILVSQFPLPGEGQFEITDIKVNITEETEIFKIEWPVRAEKPELQLPGEPVKILLTMEDIRVGDGVLVTSEENIRDKTEITASQIELQSKTFDEFNTSHQDCEPAL
jgi:hypothetical protein